MRGIGQEAKLRGARAEVRLTRAFGSGQARRRRCGRERGVEVTVREQQGRRMKQDSGKGETETCDIHTQQTCVQTLEPRAMRECARTCACDNRVRVQENHDSKMYQA